MYAATWVVVSQLLLSSVTHNRLPCDAGLRLPYDDRSGSEPLGDCVHQIHGADQRQNDRHHHGDTEADTQPSRVIEESLVGHVERDNCDGEADDAVDRRHEYSQLDRVRAGRLDQ